MKFNLRDWKERHGFTAIDASKALGMSRATFFEYLKKDKLPRWLVLACMAIDEGIDEGMEEYIGS
jgi:hypothetical protein